LDRFRSIIIGAAHNGLGCAPYLAKAGRRVILLEASDRPGGLGASREFHPGFHAAVAHSANHFSEKVARDLELAAHGFESSQGRLPTIGLGLDEQHVILHQGTLSGVSAEYAATFRDYSRHMHCFADALKPFWLKTMPRIGSTGLADLTTFAHVGLNVRRPGKKKTCRNSCA